MALSRLLLPRPAVQFPNSVAGFIRTRRWSSSPPEKRASGANEPMNNTADAAEVKSETSKLSWRSICGSMVPRIKGALINNQESNKNIDSEAVVSSSVAAETPESPGTSDDALNFSARTASEVVREPESGYVLQSEGKFAVSDRERTNSASTVTNEVSEEDGLQSREPLDCPASVNVAKTQKAIEEIEKEIQGREDECNSTREGPDMKIKSPSSRTDKTERHSGLLEPMLEALVADHKWTKADHGGMKVSVQDTISRQVTSKLKTGPEINGLEAAKSSNKATKVNELLKSMTNAVQSEETIALKNTCQKDLFDASAGEKNKADAIKGLVDYLSNAHLGYPKVGSQNSICKNDKMSNTGSKKLHEQFSHKGKPAIIKQKTQEVDKQKSKICAYPVDYHVAAESSSSVVSLDVKRPDQTPGSKSKDARVFQKWDQHQQVMEEIAPMRNFDGQNDAAGASPNIIIPETVDDPDVPNALLRNPSKTIKIVDLTHGVTLYQVKESLEFRVGSISSLFLGSSSSVAYAEFKTEDAKEAAIALQSINVARNHLRLLRIDAPKTNVVRILNLNMIPDEDISSICRRYGRVHKVVSRSDAFVDVHFAFSELPNMLNILNSLNGMQLQGTRLTAVPATVFPEEIVWVLQNQPEGRRYLKSILQSLLQKINCQIDTSKLSNSLSEYYTD